MLIQKNYIISIMTFHAYHKAAYHQIQKCTNSWLNLSLRKIILFIIVISNKPYHGLIVENVNFADTMENIKIINNPGIYFEDISSLKIITARRNMVTYYNLTNFDNK